MSFENGEPTVAPFTLKFVRHRKHLEGLYQQFFNLWQSKVLRAFLFFPFIVLVFYIAIDYFDYRESFWDLLIVRIVLLVFLLLMQAITRVKPMYASFIAALSIFGGLVGITFVDIFWKALYYDPILQSILWGGYNIPAGVSFYNILTGLGFILIQALLFIVYANQPASQILLYQSLTFFLYLLGTNNLKVNYWYRDIFLRLYGVTVDLKSRYDMNALRISHISLSESTQNILSFDETELNIGSEKDQDLGTKLPDLPEKVENLSSEKTNDRVTLKDLMVVFQAMSTFLDTQKNKITCIFKSKSLESEYQVYYTQISDEGLLMFFTFTVGSFCIFVIHDLEFIQGQWLYYAIAIRFGLIIPLSFSILFTVLVKKWRKYRVQMVTFVLMSLIVCYLFMLNFSKPNYSAFSIYYGSIIRVMTYGASSLLLPFTYTFFTILLSTAGFFIVMAEKGYLFVGIILCTLWTIGLSRQYEIAMRMMFILQKRVEIFKDFMDYLITTPDDTLENPKLKSLKQSLIEWSKKFENAAPSNFNAI